MISIIIGTYNHLGDCLKPCIESLIKYTDLSDKEIIVVANGCTDGTKEYIESLGEPFKLIWFDEPLGFARANNEGIKKAKGDYIVLLNNDTILLNQKKDDWIRLLKEPFLFENAGLTGPIKGHSSPANKDFLVFFCVMIKREIFDKIGYLDEIFGVGGGEDTDFCIKAEEKGYKLIQVPSENKLGYNNGLCIGSFPIYHKGEATVSNNPKWQEIFNNNSSILAERYNYQWKLGNDCERAVFSRTDVIFPREKTRYMWANNNLFGKKILEIGCSSGYGSRFLSDGVDYTGIDYDYNIIEYAKKEFPEHKFIQADINEFKFHHYDTIIAFEVIEHLENGKEIAQKLKNHCKCLLMTVPYKEPKGLWGRHHKLHGLTEKDFPDFKYVFMDANGKLMYEPDNAIINLMLMKWEST